MGLLHVLLLCSMVHGWDKERHSSSISEPNSIMTASLASSSAASQPADRRRAQDEPTISLGECSTSLQLEISRSTPPPRLGPMAMFRTYARPQITLLHSDDILQVPDTKLGSGLFCEVFKVQIKDPSFTEQLYAAKLMIKRDGGTSNPRAYAALECTRLSFVHPGVIAPIAFYHHLKNTILLFRYWNGSHLSHWKKLAFWNSSSTRYEVDYVKLPDDLAWLERVRKQALQLIYAFCSTMHYVHTHGMLQNDLHARNILLHFSHQNENVYLGVSDWGRSTEMGTKEHFPSAYTSANTLDIARSHARRPHVAPECFSHNPPPWNVTHEYYSIGYHISTLLSLHKHSNEGEYVFSKQLHALASKAMDLIAAKRASPSDFLDLFQHAPKYGVKIEELSGMRPDDE